MLRSCVLDFKGNWDKKLPLIEFLYNNSYHMSIDMTPYKALYRRRCRPPDSLVWDWRKVTTTNFIRNTTRDVKLIRQRLEVAPSRRKSCTDKHRRALEFQVGDSTFPKSGTNDGCNEIQKEGKTNSQVHWTFWDTWEGRNVAYKLAQH